MPYLPAEIYVLNRIGAHYPIAGVVVRLLDRQGRLILSQAVTDVTGKATFLLPTELSPYQVRCYKQGVWFDSPALIDVVDVIPPVPNSFNLYGDALTPPVSKDARLCVAYGYFKDGTNSPFAGCTLHFMPKFEPLIIDGNAVLKERTLTRTDSDGYLEIGLIRCAKYDVLIEGMEDQIRTIYVPDQVNVNLPDLLFPVVALVDLLPLPPYTVRVGQEMDVNPTVWTSSGLQLYATANQDVRWSSSNPDVAAVTVTPDKLVLRGMQVGTAQLEAVRYDNSIVRIPNTPILGVPVDITVTP